MSVPLVFSPRALMGKVCAWHCILSSQRKYVLLCAISLGACGNEGAQRRQTFDRQEWYYDILMCSAAGKYSSCLHFLFRGGFDTFWFGTSVFFFFFSEWFSSVFIAPTLTSTGGKQETDRERRCYRSRFLFPHSPSSTILYYLSRSRFIYIHKSIMCIATICISFLPPCPLWLFPTNTAENERQQKKKGGKSRRTRYEKH